MKNIKPIFLIVLVAHVLLSCNNKHAAIPDTVLSKEEMIPVLTDIHLAQSAVSLALLNDSVKYSLNDYTTYILKSKNIPRDKFESSVNFYSQHPDLLEEIYNEVIIELSKLQSESGKK